MYRPKAKTLYRRLLSNPAASQRSRLDALARLDTVPISTLLKLLKDPTTPARLRARLTERYDAEQTVRYGASE